MSVLDPLGFWESPMYLRLYRWRRVVTMGLYSLIAATGYLIAYLVRFEFDVPLEYQRTFALSVGLLLASRLVFNLWFRLTTSRWRYVGTRDVARLFGASTMGTILFYVLAALLPFDPDVPRSIILLEWVLNTYGTAGLWLSYRTGFEEMRKLTGRRSGDVQRVLLVGAGEAANLLAREIYRYPGYRVVGYVDDDPRKIGTLLQGLPVFGRIADLPRVIAREDVQEIVVAVPSAKPEQLREIVAHCETTTVPFKLLPGIREVLEGNVRVDQLRDLRIEDLLGRPPVQLELPELAEDLRGRSVLVTGAAGSIGSELSRQIALHDPGRLILMDQAESDLFFLNHDLQVRFPELLIVPVVGDVTDRIAVDRTFRNYAPDRVYHAAAYKHVPLMEANACEAVRNNVIGTQCVASAAGRYGADRFVLVSTDKAVRPSSIMGATKRMAELLVLELQREFPNTAYAAVRFGNVLGSNGSVIPLFRRQLEAGMPLTVTHEDATRYFMTIPEAVQLILQASLLPEFGGHIFMLEMGEPVKIMDLANSLLRLAGRPANAKNLVITGLRPGEKLHEELVAPDEETIATPIQQVRMVRTGRDTSESLGRLVLEWERHLERGAIGEEAVMSSLKARFAGIHPEETPRRVLKVVS